ncbi:hypothetical protein ACM55F_11550 [Flavobacterium sp. XS2P12]
MIMISEMLQLVKLMFSEGLEIGLRLNVALLLIVSKLEIIYSSHYGVI